MSIRASGIEGGDLNYRHAFHAGNFADVGKHVALALCLERLAAKDKPLRYIDTHAGIGLYDLQSEEALRSPEWRAGVGVVLEAAIHAPEAVREALDPWMRAIRSANPNDGLRRYPGSPLVAKALLREADVIQLCELHPEDAETLRTAMASVSGGARVRIEERDGFGALPAYTPPPERRGLVLIDPPFEDGAGDAKLDHPRMLSAMRSAWKRWPTGVYVLWRPLKDIDAAEAFDAELATMLIDEHGCAPEKLLAADIWIRSLEEPGPLAGAGMLIVNAPFGVRERLETAFAWLSTTMGDAGGGWRVVSPANADDEIDADDDDPWG